MPISDIFLGGKWVGWGGGGEGRREAKRGQIYGVQMWQGNHIENAGGTIGIAKEIME